MTNQEEWNEFINDLVTNAIADHKSAKECECWKTRQEQIDEFSTTNLTQNIRLL